MRIIKPGYELLTAVDETAVYRAIERAARTCYRSEERITDDGTSARRLVGQLIARGHEAMLEFVDLTVLFTVDRGVSHELVRHRLASFAQESTRYCNYGSDDIAFVLPPWVTTVPTGIYPICWDGLYGISLDLPLAVSQEDSWWFWHMAVAERDYGKLLQHGWQPQQARTVLPNSLATHIVVKANLREWRHIIALRTAHAAHPQMREAMIPLAVQLAEALPLIFGPQAAETRP
ncbi:MAG TPA: FAD-dependent thymidylate synthase [Armatimonadota bacterium]|jgi:thymidylate synthase (FAD)